MTDRQAGQQLQSSWNSSSSYGTSDMNSEFDGSIRQGLLRNGVPPTPGFQPGFLNRIHLQQLIKPWLLTPSPIEIVEMHPAGFDITDDRVSPLR
jgi:hypothetical protein